MNNIDLNQLKKLQVRYKKILNTGLIYKILLINSKINKIFNFLNQFLKNI